MTHHTDAELLPCPFCGCAAHFEMDDDRWEWIECGSCGMEGNRSASLMEDCKPKLAEAWNRRAPAAPVPQWGKAGTCEWHDGYADHSDGGGPYKERVLYTAPQPPEGLNRENPATKPEAAPVQLPEPVAWRDPTNLSTEQSCTYQKWKRESWPHIYTQALYTEQQVRELLAANGIKVAP